MRALAIHRRFDRFTRTGQLAPLAMLAIMMSAGCGSVNSAGGDAAAGTSGQGGRAGNGAGGSTGSAGSTGTAGSGAAGTTGTGGSNGGSGGSSGGAAGTGGGGNGGVAGSAGSGGGGSTGTGGVGGATGSAGRGGTTGSAGTGGSAGRGGAGGSAGTTGSGGSAGGRGGSTGGGGAGGTTSPCQTVLALDRSCTTPADCFAGAHVTNCCGTAQYVGFRNSVKTAFQTLEAACDATYPACECPIQQPTTDDGSALRFGDEPGVTCLQGKCTTFVPDCGQPCGSGTTCFSCVNHQQMFAACTTMCTGNTQCHDPSLPLCQMGMSGNTAGKFCTAANVACDTK